MRLTTAELKGITGRERPHAQARWFREHFGVDLPRDESGPILTLAAFVQMVAKRAGVVPEGEAKRQPQVKRRAA